VARATKLDRSKADDGLKLYEKRRSTASKS